MLSEFNKNEMKDLYETFSESKYKEGDVFFERDGIPIQANDVVKIENDDAISHRVIAMFVYYLNLI
jgi:hypothetical protein